VPLLDRAAMGIERERLAAGAGRDGLTPWHEWGPFVSARNWGTVREDYSADGDAWRWFPHDHARSRAYRWGEDGLAAVCDRRQGMCLGLALWNGVDPILKERAFGLANEEGNHGEDAKDLWWHLDAVPSSAWLAWRYHYPQRPFPYDELLAGNAARTVDDPELELVDTGAFDDDRYWVVDVAYAKADVDDLCMRVTVRNAGPEPATLHVLPHLWFRNTWSWGKDGARPSVRLAPEGDRVVADHPGRLGRWQLVAGDGPAGEAPRWLFCENETNAPRIWGDGVPATTPYPKDGIGDHVIDGAATVNPDGVGTKAAAWWTVTLGPGESAELRCRLAAGDGADEGGPDLGPGFETAMSARRAEADEFYAELTPTATTAEDARILRQAFAGLLWSQQFYRYDVTRWLDGDPAEPPPPAGRGAIRNGAWRHLDANDVIAMPDTWEYPWFASWDLAFHCVALAHLDPALAKAQLLLLTREWYQHPDGALPAYEWDLSDANPPVQAWAALRVFEIDGSRDHDFLKRIFNKLVINFTWWVNREDADGNDLFEGGFLGLDNIGPFNRSKPLPGGATLSQSDGTAWMAMYCLDLLQIAVVLAGHDRSYEDMAVKFFEHFALIAAAMNEAELWDDADGFYYDAARLPDGTVEQLRVRSMVGLVPLAASAVAPDAGLAGLDELVERVRWFLTHRPDYAGAIGRLTEAKVEEGAGATLLSVVSPERLARVLERVLDTDEFLSPHGLRSLSRWHAQHPFHITLGGVDATVDYEPAESRSRLFGGNSNWRGPVWFPLNFLLLESLRRSHGFLGDGYTVALPTGSDRQATLAEVADDLADRLTSLFRRGSDGVRPAARALARFEDHPDWRDLPAFYEYFDGDDGTGLGASHQTGWTALVADLILSHGRAVAGPG
jgi:hypothetical protein